jgi:hypothetical protein
MMGITGTNAIVGIQLGYSVSDIISKCGVGLVRVMVVRTSSIDLSPFNSTQRNFDGGDCRSAHVIIFFNCCI